MMTVHDVAKMSGLSVRTLRHYDHIGLLTPARRKENGYRDYSEEDLAALQQILFFRACGFPLAQIGALIHSPDFDKEKALIFQKNSLLHERARIDAMLATLEQTLRALERKRPMTAKERFKGFDFSKNPYEAEARKLWGDGPVDASNAHTSALSEVEKQNLSDGMDALFRSLAAHRHLPYDSAEAQAAIGEMYQYFNQNFGHHYTPDAFEGLGKLYVSDARFTENIDAYGDGLSAFLEKAMGYFAEKARG
ncbi:MerR family transcriptional regulator [Oscillospiraceae bacterium OttesenSCG-928-F05]|nr:MerR family transcriptional regulator [Oscillospiraceae bacterium OttesenSCG-928-F05]